MPLGEKAKFSSMFINYLKLNYCLPFGARHWNFVFPFKLSSSPWCSAHHELRRSSVAAIFFTNKKLLIFAKYIFPNCSLIFFSMVSINSSPLWDCTSLHLLEPGRRTKAQHGKNFMFSTSGTWSLKLKRVRLQKPQSTPKLRKADLGRAPSYS